MPLPLSAILGAIVNEFGRAATAADAYRGHLKRLYAQNALLAEQEPSRIRIREATLSLPLALEEVADAPVRDYGLTSAQIREMLPSTLAKARRQDLAERMHAELERGGKNSLLGPDLKKDGVEAFKTVKAAERFDGELAVDAIDKIRRDFAEHPNEGKEARFLFRTAELETVDRERIIRLEVKLDID